MNVGQILEVHLGWACANLGKQIGVAVEEYRRTGAAKQELLDQLKDIYGEKVFADQIAGLDDEMCIRDRQKAKPTGAKGTYLQKIAVSSTMGPGIRVDVASLAS